ncbi:MAG: ABC transporter permease [Bryobacterales bacterium]|nr:ABC transporter permease [Bryobacterales bacterium]
MTWRHIFAESIAALRFHRQRSIFTTLSLAWGDVFVILISYGDGFERALVKAFTAVGQNLVLTIGGQTSEQAGGLRSGRRVRLEYADANIVKESVPLVDKLSPEIMKNGVKAQHLGREKDVSVRAVWPEYDIVRNIKIVEGRWLNEDDRQHQYRVVILGAKVAKDLFGGAPAVDEDVILNGIHFTVIGVMDNKLQIANYNRSDNQCVFIPYESFSVFGDTKYPWFLVWKPVLGADQQRAIQMVRAKLAELHRFSPTDEKAVEILAFSKFMTIITGMSLAVKLLLGFVGALTLAIGGVGLANIMLASVIDRTRDRDDQGAGRCAIDDPEAVSGGGMPDCGGGWGAGHRVGRGGDLSDRLDAISGASVQGYDGHGRHLSVGEPDVGAGFDWRVAGGGVGGWTGAGGEGVAAGSD